MGMDALWASIVWQEQGYSGCTGPGFALHSDIVAPYVYNYGSEEQKTRLLPQLVSGEMISAIAMTEPSAGSDLQGIRTTAVKQDNGSYVLNGSKTFITNGWHADMCIVVAKTAPEKGAHGISLFVVEKGMAGFEKGNKLKKVGMKAQDTAELFFDNVELPPEALLGKENHGFYMLMQELPQERLLIADMALASSEAAYEWTREYVNGRKAFGSTLSKLQTIRHRLAKIKTDLVVGRTFMDRCLELHAQHKCDNATASMAKYSMTELQGKVLDDCLQLHGGWGYMWDYPIARAFADARVQRIYGGSNEIMLELIARDI
jgi:long-chain-acyl-CoA dehydrogenase